MGVGKVEEQDTLVSVRALYFSVLKSKVLKGEG